MKHLFMTIILLVSPYLVEGQAHSQKLDSLLNRLKTDKEDSNKVLLLGNIGNNYMGNNIDSSVYYFNIAKKLSEKLNYTKGILQYYSHIGDVFTHVGKYDSSLLIAKQSVAIAKAKGSKAQLAYCFANVGNAFSNLKKNDSTAFYMLKATSLLDSIHDQKSVFIMYGNLCTFYYNIEQYTKAKYFAQKAEKLHQQGVGSDYDYIYVALNMSSVYESLHQLDSALIYAYKVKALLKQEKDYYLMMINLQNIMSFKIGQHKYSELMPLVKEMELVKKDFNTPEFQARLNFCYANAYYYNGNAKFAEPYALKALEICQKNKLEDFSKKVYLSLNNIEAALGNFALSDKYYNKLDSLNTAQLNTDIAENVQDLEKKYETEKKDNEILKLNVANAQKSTQNKILIGLTFGLLALAFLGYRNFKNRQEIAIQQQTLQQQKITELEKDKQLQSIDSMLKGQEDERNRIAKDLHDGLGGMLSGVKMSFMNMKENLIMSSENVSIFERSISQLDNTISELRKIAHNLMPEALVRFGLNDAIKDFCTSMTTATHINIVYESMGETRELDNTANVYIYRIIQELVNNAIKHGQPNQVFVQLTTTPNKILITVEDDGKGLKINELATSKGIGISNIKHRVNYFKGLLEFDAKSPNGTVVNIELNV